MCLVSTTLLLTYRCPLSRTRLLLYPFPEPPNIQTGKTTPHANRLYHHLIPNEILYHNPSTTLRIVFIFPSHVTSSFWLMFLLSGFLWCGFQWFVRSGYSGISSILTQIIVLFDGPLVAFCGSLYLFLLCITFAIGSF